MTKTHIMIIMRENGYRFTKSRENMIDIFLENQAKHMTIDEIINLLSVKEQVNVATVYNNLATYVECGVVEEFNFKNKKHYELTRPLHAHFVCVKCGKIFNVEIPGLECLNIEIYRKYKANVINKVIEFEGYCNECGDDSDS